MVTFDNVLINLVRANIIQNIQEKYTGDTFRQAKNKGTERYYDCTIKDFLTEKLRRRYIYR